MDGMQAVVVRWMARQLDRLPWSAERWAKEASLAPTTVTRAMSPNYKSVSSVPTLHALARAAGVPSVLDLLDGQTRNPVRCPILLEILTELLPAAGISATEKQVKFVAEAMSITLIGLAEQEGDGREDPVLARKLARAAKAAVQHR